MQSFKKKPTHIKILLEYRKDFFINPTKNEQTSTLTIHTENENQINRLKAFQQGLKISFEINKEEHLTDGQREKILK